MTIELTQIELNIIRLLLEREPLAQAVLEENMSTGELYRHRVLKALLEKLPPYRETTAEEREASYKAVGVTPLDHFTRCINNISL